MYAFNLTWEQIKSTGGAMLGKNLKVEPSVFCKGEHTKYDTLDDAADAAGFDMEAAHNEALETAQAMIGAICEGYIDVDPELRDIVRANAGLAILFFVNGYVNHAAEQVRIRSKIGEN